MPATPLETIVPALQSISSYQESHARDAVFHSNQDCESAVEKQIEPCGDLDLTVSFLGCPSNSTMINMQNADHVNNEVHIDKFLGKKLPTNGFKSEFDLLQPKYSCAFQKIQGRNNNRCSDSKDGEASDQENDVDGDVEEEREYSRSRQTYRNRSRERGMNNFSFAPVTNNMARQNRRAAENENSPDNCTFEMTTKPQKGSNNQRSNPAVSSCDGTIVSISSGSLRDIKPGKSPNPEEGSPEQQTKKSSASIASYGRSQNSRIHRSPQQRKKKGDYAQGSSAPVPFMPTPAQSSTGCTDVSRPTSTSPSRKDVLAKNCPQRPSSAVDNLIKGTKIRHREVTENIADLSDSWRCPAKPPSSSIGSSDLHRYEESKAPSQSSAESDLRENKSSLSQSKQYTVTTDPYQMPCQLILPEEPWCNGAPHGDFEKDSPQKARQQQQISETTLRKKFLGSKTSSLSQTPRNPSSDMKIPASEVSVIPWDNVSRIMGKKSTKEDNKTSLSSSIGTISGSNSSRSRSTRRHPVLDKMFRHVLASLVMESGPPSSACLASVVDQVEGSGTSDSLRSHSRTISSVSSTDTFTSRLSNCRFGMDRKPSQSYHHAVQSNLDDDTMPLSNPLPCRLQKINEETKS